MGAFTVGTDGSQLSMWVHTKVTASDNVTAILSLRYRTIVVRTSTMFHPAIVALIGGLTIIRYIEHSLPLSLQQVW
jgi:hypothetical protein